MERPVKRFGYCAGGSPSADSQGVVRDFRAARSDVDSSVTLQTLSGKQNAMVTQMAGCQ